MPLPHLLLIASLIAVWLPALPLGGARRLPLWWPLALLALFTALAQGLMQWQALPGPLLLAAAAWGTRRAGSTAARVACWAATLLLSLALALHLWPGFQNPKLFDAVRFTADAKPFTQYLNLDKGLAGLLLLALLCPRLQRGDRLGPLLATFTAGLVLTALAVFAVGLLSGGVHWAPKWPDGAALFLLSNLAFTCVAEEAFFRALVQDALAGALKAALPAPRLPARRRHWVLALSALLFGLVHAKGGGLWMLFAGVAGLGYAAVYGRSQRIEAAIGVHFGINVLHFLLFTYPALA